MALRWVGYVDKAVGLDELFGKHYSEANEDAIMRFMIEDEENPSSILSCVKYARENTRTLRELLPEELWERSTACIFTFAIALISQHRVVANVIWY